MLEAFGLCRVWTDVSPEDSGALKTLATAAVEPLLRLAATRLGRQAYLYDRIVGERGLGAGGAWAVERLSRGVSVCGAPGIPGEGPVVVVSNHPGLADSLSLFSAIPRDDLRVVAAERALLDALPDTSRYLIPADDGVGGLRRASRHLRRGGALLTFPKGRIEPDPASMPGAEASLTGWRHGLDIFTRLAPEITVVPAVVSGVISHTALASPVTRIRRLPEDRRWLAASLQMLVPALRDVHAEVRFGRPLCAGANVPDVSRVGEEALAEARRMIRLAESKGHDNAWLSG